MGCNYIALGKLTVAILKDTRLLGAAASCLAVRLAKGETDLGLPLVSLNRFYQDGSITGVIPCDFLPLKRVTKSNLKEFVVDSGWQSYEGVYEGVDNPPPM
jgi:ABC-type xylose transport system substrate-binding protein